MRSKIATAAAAGVLGVSGLVLAGPALAATGADGAATAVSSRVDRIKTALQGLVTDGTLTQDQADKVATTLAERAPEGRGPGGPGHGGRGLDLSAAATALGLTEDALRTELQAGKSLATVAQDKGVAVDVVVTALVDAEKARIAQAVTDGRLTQAQADERLADLQQRVTDRVNSTGLGRGHGHGPRGGAGDDDADEGAQTPTPAPTPS